MADLEVPVQRVRAVTRDEYLEPDAMRGTEHYLRNIKDGDGNRIDPVDEEEARRQFASNAIESRSPIRVTSPQTMTPAAESTPTAVPVSEAPPTSPNIQRASIGAGTTAPVVSDPGVDWQAKARAEGWAPRDSSSEYDADVPPTTTPVPNANPAFEGAPVPETAPLPTPASGAGEAANG